MDAPAIDAATFEELRDSVGAEFVRELVSTFLEEAPTLLATLRSASAAGDAEGFRRAAHSLKSNGNTFGALTFGAMARDLELGGLKSDPSTNGRALDALDAAYVRAAAALTELRGE